MKADSTIVKVIGFSLLIVYGLSLWAFFYLFQIPDYLSSKVIYLVLFASLFLSSAAVIWLKDWGRRLVIYLNVIMLLTILLVFIPRSFVVPASYFFLNVIVFLYFSQEKVKKLFTLGYAAKRFSQSILVVDDDETVREIVRLALIREGYSVLTADSGEQGLSIAKNQKPDLVLLDVIMPGMKGRKVCKELKDDPATADIPVVFLTAKDSPEDIAAEKEVGAVAHLTKPIDGKIILNTIKKLIG